MATRYWVGGSGTWSSTTKWSATSGGASGASVPTSADDVIFDANSAVTNCTITVTATANCNQLTVSSKTSDGTGGFLFVASSAQTLNCYGGISLATASTNVSSAFTFNFFNSNSASPCLINCRGNTVDSDVFFYGSSGLFRFVSEFYNPTGYISLGSEGTGHSFTIDFNGQRIQTIAIYGTGTNNITVNLGASNITLRGNLSGFCWNITNPNLILNAGTSVIDTFFGSESFAGGGRTYATVELAMTFGEITGNNTFGTLLLDFSSFAGSDRTFVFMDDQTIGTLSFRSPGRSYDLSVVGGKYNGTTLTVGAQSGTLSDWNFANIKIAGAVGTLTGTNLGNGGNNTNISGYAAARNVYWVGATSDSFSASTSWSLTSNGAASTLAIPRPQDTCVFGNTYPASGGTADSDYTLYHPFPTLDTSARTTPLTINLPTSAYFYGSLILGSSTTLGIAGGLRLNNPTGITLNCASSLSETITVGNLYPSVVSLANNFTCTNPIYVVSGTFNTNNYSLTATSFLDGSTTDPRTINFGSSLVTLTGSGTPFSLTSTGLTWNAGTSTIRLSSASAKTFDGDGRTYYNLDQGGAGTLTITGANTFNDVTHSYGAASTIRFPAATTTTLANLTAAGTASYQVTLTSSTGTTQATLSKASGSVSLSYVTYSYLNATGGALWGAYPANGVINGGNNTGWTTSQNISLAAAASVIVSRTAALSKRSNLSTITSAAASATAALRKFANLSYIAYADSGYVAPGYFQENDIVVTATARLSTTLASSAVSVATASASLDKTSRLATAAVSTATSTVALTKSFTLDSSAVSGVTAAASLDVVKTLSQLTGTAAVTNVINATLSKTVPLVGSNTASSTASANLDTPKALASSVTAATTSTALLELNNTLGSLFGTAAVTNVISANLLNSYTLASVANSVATASGTTENTKPLAAIATSVTTSTVALGKTVELAANVFSETDVVIAAFSGITGLTSSAVSTVTATGNIIISKPLAAAASVVVSTNTTLYRNFKIFAVASASVTATATITHNVNLSYALYIDSGYVDPGYLQEGNVVTATGRLATTMASAAVSATSATGDLEIAKPIAATAVSQVTSSAQLLTSYVLEPLTGLGAVTNVMNATLAVGKVFASSVTCLTVIEGGLSLSNNLAATVSAVTTVDPASTTVERGMAANAASFSSASGSVALTLRVAGTALSLAAVNGRLVVARSNEIEGLGATSAEISYSQLLVDAAIVNISGDVSYESVTAEVSVDDVYVDISGGLIYAETEVFENDLTVSVTPANVFVYKQAA